MAQDAPEPDDPAEDLSDEGDLDIPNMPDAFGQSAEEPSDDAPEAEAPSEDGPLLVPAPDGATSSEDAPSDGDVSADEPPADEAPADEAPVEEAPPDELPEDASSADTGDAVADAGLDELEPRAADPSPTTGAVAMSEFQRELRTVEEGVSSLKERVFRAKATLELLKELVIDAADAGARLVVWHDNALGGGYDMESVQYFLDGRNVYSRVDADGYLEDNREFQVHEQTVSPGTHELSVSMVLRGRGFRIFSYLRNYEFKLQSSYAFDVAEGMISVVRVISDTRGGLRSFVERPTVQYEARSEPFREE